MIRKGDRVMHIVTAKHGRIGWAPGAGGDLAYVRWDDGISDWNRTGELIAEPKHGSEAHPEMSRRLIREAGLS